ncbi:MAG: fumarylacetoacetate hydrolase family protein [Pseudomonadota bacterium]
MKFLRHGAAGAEKPGCVDANGTLRDLSGIAIDFAGAGVASDALAALADRDLSDLPELAPDTRIGCALADVPNFYCIGLNYARHAAETGAEPPKEPIIFSKATSALSGPFDPVVIPKDSEKTDWEVELGVVIGREVAHVREAQALDCVSAYCTINDVSERAFQIERGGQWIKGKSAPSFAPLGPWLVSAADIADPQNLALSLKLNGETVQSSSTSDMIFGVAEIISYMSRFMTLRPGDVIATGTPEGVGMGMRPQRFLRPGDVMDVHVEGLGTQRQEAKAYGT